MTYSHAKRISERTSSDCINCQTDSSSIYISYDRDLRMGTGHTYVRLSRPIFTQGREKRTGKGSSRNKQQESQVDTRPLLMQNIWNEAPKTSQEGWQFREAWVKREDKQWELPERHTAVQLELNTLPNFEAFKALRLIWSLELTWSKGSQSIDTDNNNNKKQRWVKVKKQSWEQSGHKCAANSWNVPHHFWTEVTLEVSPDAKLSYGINLAGSASAGAVSTYLCLRN